MTSFISRFYLLLLQTGCRSCFPLGPSVSFNFPKNMLIDGFVTQSQMDSLSLSLKQHASRCLSPSTFCNRMVLSTVFWWDLRCEMPSLISCQFQKRYIPAFLWWAGYPFTVSVFFSWGLMVSWWTGEPSLEWIQGMPKGMCREGADTTGPSFLNHLSHSVDPLLHVLHILDERAKQWGLLFPMLLGHVP